MRDRKNVFFLSRIRIRDTGSGFKILICRIRPKMDRIRNPASYLFILSVELELKLRYVGRVPIILKVRIPTGAMSTVWLRSCRHR